MKTEMCFLQLSARKETLRTKINHFLFTGLRSGGEEEEEQEEEQEEGEGEEEEEEGDPDE